MLRKLPVFLFIALGCTGLLLAKPKKPSLPEQFEHAKSVFVESRNGDLTDLRLERDQRDAILDMQDGMEAWGRYALASSRIDADLIVVVYRGQYYQQRTFPSTVAGPGAGSAHSPLQSPQDASIGDSSQAHPTGTGREKDELRIYTLGQDGKLKGPIWKEELDNGLRAPNLFLLQTLKYQVEKAYPTSSAKQPTTP